MPALRPIAIPTFNRPWREQIEAWLFSGPRDWEIVEDWEFQLPGDRPTIIIPKGFVFNGASVPRLLWPLLSPTGLLLIPALIHDFSYDYRYLWQKDSDGNVSKYLEGAGNEEDWDALFEVVGKHVNDMPIVDWLAWLAVSLFGDPSWGESTHNAERGENAELLPVGYHELREGSEASATG